MSNEHTDGSRSGGQPVLLPCPFCGGRAEIAEIETEDLPLWLGECQEPSCEAVAPVRPTIDEAIAAWNTRQPTQSDALRDQTHVEAAQALWNSISDDYNGWAHLSDIERDNIALALSAHHQHGYDQGYYDGQRGLDIEQRKLAVFADRGLEIREKNDD